MDIFQHGHITEEPLRGGADEDDGDSGGDTDTDEPEVDDSQLWGYLQPCSVSLQRINLFKEILRYSFGRDDDNNLIGLRSPNVSLLHCVLTWDPVSSAVTVLDTSSNGTWLDGEKVGRGNTVPLTDGTEIGFGTAIRQPAYRRIRDFRYIFHYVANGPPTEGVRAYFHTVAQLGKGATGTVFLAGHKTTGLPFAVKRIVKMNGGGLFLRKELLEVSAMKRLEHPNICKLIQVFDTNLEISLVLEFVNGGDLITYITERYPSGIPELIAKDMVHQACNAMAFIHSKGIIHRDLKLENILLTRDTHPIVKIADFGTAAAVDDLALLRKQCGTPYYFAPEIISSGEDEQYDDKVDSWSMGIMVYAMLTGCFPFQTVQVRKPSSLTEYIATRSIDWDLINTKRGLFTDTLIFIYELLRENPAHRMSLTDSRNHPWLRDHIPFHTNLAAVFTGKGQPTDGDGDTDVVNRPLTLFETMKRERAKAMNKAGRRFVAKWQLDSGAGWFHERQVGNVMSDPRGGVTGVGASGGATAASGTNGIGFGFGARVGSSANLNLSQSGSGSGSSGSGSFVRRRSDVIDEACEAGTPIPEPSQEMIAYTLRRRSRRISGKGKGKGKERAVDVGLGESSSSSSLGMNVEERPEAARDVQMTSPSKKGGQGGLRTSPRKRRSSGIGSGGGGGQSVDVDRQEGPSDWAGAMRVEEGDGGGDGEEEEEDVEMDAVGENVATRPGAVTRARTRKLKERAVAARKVRSSSGQVGDVKGKAKGKKRL